MTHRLLLAAGLLLLLFVAGCGFKEPGTLIQGNVSFNGTPLESGTIAFVDSAGNPQVFKINNGKYEARVFPIGEMSITFKGYKVVGQTPRNDFEGDTVMLDKFESILPPKYSQTGEFSMNVTEKSETKDFALTSN